MKLSSLASSSEGNCIYVGTKKTNVLVDCGVSAKRIENSLSELDLTVPEFDGILITHEHTDHIKGLGVIARRYGLPIFATGKTIDAIFDYKNLGKVNKSLFHSIEADKPFEIGDMKVNASHIWHDAADPVCYSFYSDVQDKLSLSSVLQLPQSVQHIFHSINVPLFQGSVSSNNTDNVQPEAYSHHD